MLLVNLSTVAQKQLSNKMQYNTLVKDQITEIPISMGISQDSVEETIINEIIIIQAIIIIAAIPDVTTTTITGKDSATTVEIQTLSEQLNQMILIRKTKTFP